VGAIDFWAGHFMASFALSIFSVPAKQMRAPMPNIMLSLNCRKSKAHEDACGHLIMNTIVCRPFDNFAVELVSSGGYYQRGLRCSIKPLPKLCED
jgi:hypothetical protein